MNRVTTCQLVYLSTRLLMYMKQYMLLLIMMMSLTTTAQAQSWPEQKQEAKAGTRWWWLGSAVDKDNLRWTMQQYADHGIGAVEITPLYGVQGNQANNIPYLSDRWMEMLREVQKNGKELGIEVDMATGTGWPFGGPWVPLEESACKVIFVEKDIVSRKGTLPDVSLSPEEAVNTKLDRIIAYDKDGEMVDLTSPTAKKVIAVYIKYGVMKVKRAAPGGEGWVIDHFDKQAVAHYLQHIEEAFERTHTPYPHTFFNDSYEVANATWTPTLFEEFEKRRGYQLQQFLPLLIHAAEFVGDHSQEDSTYQEKKQLELQALQVLSDYRETLGDLLLENFTEPWTARAHSHGAITRNQAHGSPANLIDCYAVVDIPEIEGFGLSDLGIKGLRTDPGKTRKNDSDYSMFKYAPSAAHICGKPYTSSETFTWLTEHFRTSLSQLKPDLDLMFCAGVNHIFFHGSCYSPKDDPWPGWKFYASIDMSPTNSIWRDAPFFMQYVERCQNFLQWGQPDNDFLVYLPIRDMWKKNPNKLLMQFSIHAMGGLAPEFRQTILDIDRAGFDCDYISERLLMKVIYKDGMLQTESGTRYKGLIIPGSGEMPKKMTDKIRALRQQGAPIIIGTDIAAMNSVAKPEPMKTQHGLKAIRRKNPTGYHYFIANLTSEDICDYIHLAVPLKQALWFNPLTGDRYAASLTEKDEVLVALKSGQSMILETFDNPVTTLGKLQDNIMADTFAVEEYYPLNGPWTLTFTEEAPKVDRQFTLDALQTWETLGDNCAITMGTGVYTTHIQLKRKDFKNAHSWMIDLGDVRESARVYINDRFIGCAWSVPFQLDCKNALKKGVNEIRIEVTNLPANRIADMDRKGIKWRKMEEINVVDINYKNTTYDQWEPVKSGLNSTVSLIKY